MHDGKLASQSTPDSGSSAGQAGVEKHAQTQSPLVPDAGHTQSSGAGFAQEAVELDICPELDEPSVSETDDATASDGVGWVQASSETETLIVSHERNLMSEGPPQPFVACAGPWRAAKITRHWGSGVFRTVPRTPAASLPAAPVKWGSVCVAGRRWAVGALIGSVAVPRALSSPRLLIS